MFFRKTLLVVASILHILQSAETPLTPKTPSPSRLPALPDEAFVVVDYTRPILPFTDASEYEYLLHREDNTLRRLQYLAKVARFVDVVERARQASTTKLDLLGLTVDLEDVDNVQYLFMGTAYAARRLRVKRRLREASRAICILGGILFSIILRLGEGPELVDVVVAVVRKVCQTRRTSIVKIRRQARHTRRRACATAHKSVRLVQSVVQYLDVRLLLMTFLSFDIPMVHLALGFVLDGTAVSGLTDSVCRSVLLPVQYYRQARGRAYTFTRKSIRVVYSVVRYLDVRLLLMTVLSFDIPLVHLVCALLLDGTALRVLATKIPIVRHVPDELFPSPIIKVRRAKKRYKRGHKAKPQ